MDFQILQVFSPEEAELFLAKVSKSHFTDGKTTAFGIAREAKQNLQADRSVGEWQALDEAISAALCQNKQLQMFAYPKRILAPTYSRYEPGMHYGPHVDGALMGGGHPMRSDLAMTIFLSPPDSYDGGELVIHLAFGEQEIKLGAGEAVVYPAGTLHHVAPVTRGVRMVVVTWIQCAVRDQVLRGILFDLGQAISNAEASKDTAAITLLTKCYHNLLRHSVDP